MSGTQIDAGSYKVKLKPELLALSFTAEQNNALCAINIVLEAYNALTSAWSTYTDPHVNIDSTSAPAYTINALSSTLSLDEIH